MTLSLGGITLAMASLLPMTQQAWLPMYVGTYTATDSKGIYYYQFNQDNGEAKELSATPASNPSYLAFSADKRTLYAVNESDTDADGAQAFAIGESGQLQPLSSYPTDGKAPCYIQSFNDMVLTANYNGGSIALFSCQPEGDLKGKLQTLEFPLTGPAPDKKRQNAAHLHCVVPSPDKKYIFACDLGNDCIYTLTANPTDATPLTVVNRTDLKAGSGPRHLTFAPNGEYAYVITELSGEVLVFKVSDKELQLQQTIDCDPADARGSADIRITPDGRFLYASNRLKNDGISIYAIHPTNGTLRLIGYQTTGVHPRNFAITPNGKFLLCACRDSNRIEVYAINEETGLLTNTHQDIQLPMPVCVLLGE